MRVGLCWWFAKCWFYFFPHDNTQNSRPSPSSSPASSTWNNSQRPTRSAGHKIGKSISWTLRHSVSRDSQIKKFACSSIRSWSLAAKSHLEQSPSESTSTSQRCYLYSKIIHSALSKKNLRSRISTPRQSISNISIWPSSNTSSQLHPKAIVRS